MDLQHSTRCFVRRPDLYYWFVHQLGLREIDLEEMLFQNASILQVSKFAGRQFWRSLGLYSGQHSPQPLHFSVPRHDQ